MWITHAGLGTAGQAALEEQHVSMVAYLHMKVATSDWHGVMDAAADLREIEAEIKGRQEATK